MRLRSVVRILCWATVAATCCQGQQSISQARQPKASYGQLPLTFEANQGQTDAQVKFLSRGNGYTAFLTAGAIVLSLRPTDSLKTSQSIDARTTNKLRPPAVALQFSLVGGNQNSVVVGEDLQPGRVNYFIGNNPAKWQTNVPTYGRIRSKNVYPGIDLLYYGNHRQLEYDFEVAPGADPALIRFEVKGARRMHIDHDGDLVLETRDGDLQFKSPVVYQGASGQHVPVLGQYILRDSTHVGFHVSQYERSKPLVIDPVLVYSTYLGGSGADVARGIAVDTTGSVYVAGYTDSIDFPLTTLGSLPAGVRHAFIAKLDTTGSNLIYADYLGGNSQDYGDAIALDSSNNVYVTGSTTSSDFPVVNPYQGTYPGAFNAFLTKISASGSSLLYSTYLGGNGSDIPSGIAIDSTGNMVIGGYTSSTNFPVANAYQPTVSANQGGLYGTYGFLTKFNPDGSSLVYSTYFGGDSNVPLNCGGTPCWPAPSTIISGMALDSAGSAYVVGLTDTYNLPVTAGAYLSTDTAQWDNPVGFVSNFSSSGSLQYSTYFYESSGLLTTINAIAVDGTGSAYVTGAAYSDGTFPLTSTSICDPAVYGFGCSYGYVTKFDPTGSKLSYSTFLGPNNDFGPTSILVDTNGDAFVSGSSSSSSLGTVNAIESPNSGANVVLVEIDPTGGSEIWATYLGGTADDSVAGIANDSHGNLYVAGTTNSPDFPTTQATFQRMLGGGADTFVVKIAASSAPSVAISPAVLQFATQTVGSTSQPELALLRNMGSSPLSITSILTAGGDFSETDDCATSVPAAGSCNVSITFTPIVTGHRTGSVSIRDDAAHAPHLIMLSGNATGAGVTLSPSALAFPIVQVGSSSTAGSVSLFNTGNAPLHISGIIVSGDFAQSDNCPGTLAVGTACTINITFNPTASGTRGGTLTINDDASTSSQTAQLTGTGLDFTLTSSPSSTTVQSGATTAYTLTVSAAGGSFTNAVKLSCGVLPPNTTCSVSPNSVIPGGSQGLSTLTVTTTSAAAHLSPSQQSPGSWIYTASIQLCGIGLFGMIFTRPRRRAATCRAAMLLTAIASLVLTSACAGGAGTEPPGSGTPPGTYTITVTGTSGTLRHSLPLILTVK